MSLMSPIFLLSVSHSSSDEAHGLYCSTVHAGSPYFLPSHSPQPKDVLLPQGLCSGYSTHWGCFSLSPPPGPGSSMGKPSLYFGSTFSIKTLSAEPPHQLVCPEEVRVAGVRETICCPQHRAWCGEGTRGLVAEDVSESCE